MCLFPHDMNHRCDDKKKNCTNITIDLILIFLISSNLQCDIECLLQIVTHFSALSE